MNRLQCTILGFLLGISFSAKAWEDPDIVPFSRYEKFLVVARTLGCISTVFTIPCAVYQGYQIFKSRSRNISSLLMKKQKAKFWWSLGGTLVSSIFTAWTLVPLLRSAEPIPVDGNLG